MQQLEQRHTYTPTNTSQVRSNCGLPLNKEETLSVSGLKTCTNNPDVNLSQQAGRLKAVVLVLSIDSKPLMPCRPAKVKKLLKSGRASVVRRFPFTIRLKFLCENQTQLVVCGLDKGYKYIGFSFRTDKQELVSGQLTLDCKTSKRFTERSMYRKSRRSRHHWYRQPRFLNRKKGEGWLPPSTQRRIDTHIRLVKIYCKLIPVSRISIEIANFDIQKVLNPEIGGVEYQQGSLFGYENQKAYIVARETGKCQLCGKDYDNEGWHIHHIIGRAREGTNKVDNLALLHQKCHKKLHKNGVKLKANKQYKDSTFMNIARWFIIDKVKTICKDVSLTFGYITKVNRIKNNINKSHANDAFIISGGTKQERCMSTTITQKRRNNRCLQINRNGFSPSIRKQRYPIQPNDLVWIDGKKHITSGTHCRGKYIILKETKKSVLVKRVEKIHNFGSFAFN